MYKALIEPLSPGQSQRYALLDGPEPLMFYDVLGRWQHDEPFRAYFLALLEEAPFDVFRWETPPINVDTANRAFEFVLTNAPEIDLPPDSHPFQAHFNPDADEPGIVAFPNLGGDGRMIAPSPRAPAQAYSHLASFTRQAPAEQNHALWHTVGQQMARRLDNRPVWLSTAGGGVAWLHVRLDSRPKYYRHTPYRIWTP